MKTVVFGASGTLGQALMAVLPAAGYDVQQALDRKGCDLGDPAAIAALIRRFAPDAIFNAAAYTDVDRAESEPDLAYAVNAIAPEAMARAAEVVGAVLVHYSTDFVFDGERDRPYDEFDPPSPQGLYARSKLAGDQLVTAAARRAFVVRVGCLYGRGGRNFPSTILRRLRAGETVKADRDRVGSPTWVMDVARVSAALARTAHFGTYHCTSQGETSWAAFAHFMATELGLPAEQVQPLPTSALPMKAPRPRRSVLDNRMLRLRNLDTMSTWQEAARAFIKSESQVG